MRDNQDFFSGGVAGCVNSLGGELFSTANDAFAAWNLAGGAKELNNVTLVSTFLREYFFYAGDMESLYTQYGVASKKQDDLIQKIAELTLESSVGLFSSGDYRYDLNKVTQQIATLRAGTYSGANSIIQKFSLQNKLSASVGSSNLDVNINDGMTSFRITPDDQGVISVCYGLKNNSYFSIDNIKVDFYINSNNLSSTLLKSSSTFINARQPEDDCVNLFLNDAVHAAITNTPYTITLDVTYDGKKSSDIQILEVSSQNSIFDLYMKLTAPLIIASSYESSGNVYLDASKSFVAPSQGELSFKWKQIETQSSPAVKLWFANTSEALFYRPDLPVGQTQQTLWFEVTAVASVSGIETTDLVEVVLSQLCPNGEAPTYHAVPGAASCETKPVELCANGDPVVYNLFGMAKCEPGPIICPDGEPATYNNLFDVASCKHVPAICPNSEPSVYNEILGIEYCSDCTGNDCSTLADKEAPVITLNGQANITLNKGSIYIEPGATAFDKVDGNITVNISGFVDINTVGIYTVNYTAVDAAGNVAISKKRFVTIAVAQQANLTVVGFGVEQEEVNVSGFINLIAPVVNLGNTQSSSSHLRFYISSVEEQLDSNNQLLECGTPIIPAINSLGNYIVRCELNAPVISGTYYYYACVDAISNESNQSDNCSSIIDSVIVLDNQSVECSIGQKEVNGQCVAKTCQTDNYHCPPAIPQIFTNEQVAATIETAALVPYFNQTFNSEFIGEQGNSGDHWWKLNLTANEGFTVALTGHLNSSYVNFDLYDASGKIQGVLYVYDDQTRLINHQVGVTGTYYLKISGPAIGNYDLAIYSAWFNAAIVDSDRDFYSSFNTARDLASGNYTRSQLFSDSSARSHYSDYYRFTARAGDIFKVDLTGHLNSGSVNFYLYDSDESNPIKTTLYVSDGETKTLEQTINVDGVYYLKVSGANGSYNLSASGLISARDSDKDGLKDISEYHYKINPFIQDTDGDGNNDYIELVNGDKPQAKASYLDAHVGKTTETATAVPYFNQIFNSEFKGEQGNDGDHWWKLNLTANEGLTIALTGHLNSSYVNFDLYDASGKIQGVLYVYDGQTRLINHQIGITGTYYLKVSGPAIGNYDLAIYSAWFNAGIVDSDRDFYSSFNTARGLSSDSYTRSQLFSDSSARSHYSDYYRFTAGAGDVFKVDLTGNLNSGSVNFYLYDSDKSNPIKTILYVRDGETKTLEQAINVDGVYYLKVSGANGSYDFSVSGLD